MGTRTHFHAFFIDLAITTLVGAEEMAVNL